MTELHFTDGKTKAQKVLIITVVGRGRIQTQGLKGQKALLRLLSLLQVKASPREPLRSGLSRGLVSSSQALLFISDRLSYQSWLLGRQRG